MMSKGFRVFLDRGLGKLNPAITHATPKRQDAQNVADKLNSVAGTNAYVYSWSNPFDMYGRRADFYGS